MATPKALKTYKIKLNSVDNIQELLQEQYNEACSTIMQIQNGINKLTQSINLNDEAMDAKTKYAKAINDFITNKDKAIGRKLEIAKLMTEIVKYNGNVKKTLEESEAVGDWSDFISHVNERAEKNDVVELNQEKDGKITY